MAPQKHGTTLRLQLAAVLLKWVDAVGLEDAARALGLPHENNVLRPILSPTTPLDSLLQFWELAGGRYEFTLHNPPIFPDLLTLTALLNELQK